MNVRVQPARSTPVLAFPPAEADLEGAELTRKQQRKAARLLAEASRPLDPRERYRALVDTLEQTLDLAEVADRKVRFAMVVMTLLNLGLFALATHTELLGVVHPRLRGWLGGYVFVYAAVAVYFLIQAIEALRPRSSMRAGECDRAPETLRLRCHEVEAGRDLEEYRRAWREVRFDQLNAELAEQGYLLARTNQEKYAALRRLYGGLRVLVLLIGGLLAAVGLSAVLPPSSP